MQSLAFTVLLILFVTIPRVAFAWGSKEQEEMQEAAIQLLSDQNHPLAAPFSRNLETLKRVALVPDVEWQAKDEPLSSVKGGKKKAKRVSYHESGLHIFQVDAFVRFGVADNAVLSLPVGEYQDVRGKYRALLKDNVAYLVEMDRTETDPAAFGTAPWRALQLYDLAVKALQAGDLAGTLYNLGLAAHYVGDLAEPLNSSVNGNGKHYPISASGVREAFERDMFEARPLLKGAVTRRARESLGTRGLDGLTRDRILGELLRLVNDGVSLIDPVMKAFSQQCGLLVVGRALAAAVSESAPTSYCEPPVGPERARTLLAEFMDTVIGRSGGVQTVRSAAERRLGDSAALVARLWAAAYDEAGRPALASEAVPFSKLTAGENYIEPTFLRTPGPPATPATPTP